ncbi:hypothetical protein K1719_041601 [Acacia pycnantha]|nr:hypothetical protein K1719_041601 [Acacia pycnantha]
MEHLLFHRNSFKKKKVVVLGTSQGTNIHLQEVEDAQKIRRTVIVIALREQAYQLFDKRITAFAKDKFKRDGINVKTGSVVVKVSDKEISTDSRCMGLLPTQEEV